MKKKITGVLIVAAGKGIRSKSLIPKQYLQFSYGNWKKPSAFVAGSWGNSYNVPTPQANPRGPSQNFAFGGHGYPNPTANDGAWAWDKIFMYNQGNVSPETQWQQVVDGYPNSDYFYRTDNPSFVGSPNYTGGGP